MELALQAPGADLCGKFVASPMAVQMHIRERNPPFSAPPHCLLHFLLVIGGLSLQLAAAAEAISSSERGFRRCRMFRVSRFVMFVWGV
ncbi:MAG: hypothetical protein Q8P67_14940 [archaeon]|nr:hypothetical protein [archaeon]